MFPSGKKDDLEKNVKKGEVKCYSRPMPDPKHGFLREVWNTVQLKSPPCAGSETVRIVQMPFPVSFFSDRNGCVSPPLLRFRSLSILFVFTGTRGSLFAIVI